LEKVKITTNSPEMAEIKFNKQNIEVKPYLSDLDKSIILKTCSGYLWDVMSLEQSWKICILDLATNIKVVDENGEIVIDGEVLNYSNLFDQVIYGIRNYDEVRQLLDKHIENQKRQIEIQQSLGAVVDVVSTKLFTFLDGLKDLDSDKLLENGKKLLSEIEKSPVSNVFREAQGLPSKNKSEEVE